MFQKTYPYLFTTFLLLATACGVTVDAQPTATQQIITATLPPSPTPPPTETPQPPPPTATITPIEGTTTTQVNVRGEPSTAGSTYGILPPFTKVQIIAQDPGKNWVQILYPQAPDGKGWVTKTYVQVAAEAQIPVLGGANGPSAVALQQINIRSGPGTDFNSLGTVNAQDVLMLTGKNAGGSWLQVAYAAGPEGKGWVNAAFVQATGAETLPIVSEAGQVVGTGTATGVAPTAIPTVVPASEDGDSAAAPAVSVAFSPSGSRALFYTGDVSAPEGDASDWVGFTPYSTTVTMNVECTGNGDLMVSIFHAGETLPAQGCNAGMQVLNVIPGQVYLVQMQSQTPAAALESVRYTLSISTVR